MVKPLTGDDATRAYDLGEDLKIKDAERIKRRTTLIKIVDDDITGATIRRVEVPGGWLYVLNGHRMEFVPFNNTDNPSDYYALNKEDTPF